MDPHETELQKKREQRLRLLEDHIGAHLQSAEASGELRQAPSFGKPLAVDEGFEQTPTEWQLPFKMLKDAGVLPPQVLAMQEIAALRERLQAAVEGAERQKLSAELQDKQQALALQLERMAGSLVR